MSRREKAAVADASAATLRRLLDAQAAYDVEDTRGFSVHRPMVLHALARLGADAARLEACARQAEVHLRPAPVQQAWPLGDAWFSCLGQRGAWPLHRDLFTQWLDSEAAGDVLQQVLPRLMQGVAGAAFHGVIRTAHAVAAAHRAELADALAYWATCWAPLGQEWPAVAPTTRDPEAVLRRLTVVQTEAPMLAQRIRTAAAAPGFDELAATLELDARSVPALARLAARAYAATGDFGVLHLVTGALAVQELLPFIDPDDHDALASARAAYWRAFMATVSAAGLVPRPAPAAPPWSVLRAQGIASDDDHVIKLVDACVQWQAREPGGPWGEAAARALVGD